MADTVIRNARGEVVQIIRDNVGAQTKSILNSRGEFEGFIRKG